LASSTNRSEDERVLPRPELNPLVNPLLADNMGRWAEVYFTSAPDKREEAVLELLRELEAQSSNPERHSASLQAAPGLPAHPTAPAFKRATTESPGHLRRCDSCGHDNGPRNQFCGMCGAQLGGITSEFSMRDSAYDPQGADIEHAEAPAFAESHADTEYREAVDEESLSPGERPRRDPYDLSPFQSLLERESAAELEYQPSPSSRYRYYVGGVLAILILALGYAAWKGSPSDQSAQGTPPPAPPAATETAPAAESPNPATSAPSKTAEPQPATATSNTANPTPAKPAESPKQTVTAGNGTHTPAATATPTSQPAAADLEHQTLQGNGADEFVMAQRYLSGTSGQARDSAEAAKWLWKSIAKHNGPAMLALADLYLKGDGVSKNCDQARVLLDSAALRGMAGAGEKIRHLQAFGCQ
jgi:hypothetical protein